MEIWNLSPDMSNSKDSVLSIIAHIILKLFQKGAMVDSEAPGNSFQSSTGELCFNLFIPKIPRTIIFEKFFLKFVFEKENVKIPTLNLCHITAIICTTEKKGLQEFIMVIIYFLN